ncbi:MAG: hypothetical protein GY796_33475 [Chloroflexi bacterium]|nr:hypothetical protein [Chloroflexota bacterium]
MENPSLANKTTNTLDAFFHNRAALSRIRSQIVSVFNEGELKGLAMDLAINYDALPGSGTNDKTREIVALCLRQSRLTELLTLCAKLRPHLEWPDAKDLAFNSNAQQLEQAGKLNNCLKQRFSEDTYAMETLSRLVARPGVSSRKAALSNLLEELIEDDPEFADSLRTVMKTNISSHDIIQQEVILSDQAQAENITVIGKIDGNTNVNPVKKNKSWWQRLIND